MAPACNIPGDALDLTFGCFRGDDVLPKPRTGEWLAGVHLESWWKKLSLLPTADVELGRPPP